MAETRTNRRKYERAPSAGRTQKSATFQTDMERNPDGNPLMQVLRNEFTSNQIEDPFKNINLTSGGGELAIVAPPYNPWLLLRLPQENCILEQCIDAMVINIEGTGYRLEYIGPEDAQDSKEALLEKQYVEEFLEKPNDDYTFTELRRRVRRDVEQFGYSYIEVSRDSKGRVQFAWHLPAYLMRVTQADKDATTVNVDVDRFGEKIKAKVDRRFRRYVQVLNEKRVYFKEFGDPRFIDPKSGKVNNTLALPDTATEVIMIKNYAPGTPYGIPRWVHNLVAIQGSRQAELTNLDYFKDNAIPAMAILVSGGSVTEDTLQDIENHVLAARGRAAQNRVVVIEAHGDEEAASDDGTIPPPKIELKSLSSERPKDGLFLEYDKAQQDKVRSSFRLPPIFTGHAQDYSHASAKTSYEVAESQVFGPERNAMDEMINAKILSTYGVKFWAVRSNPPRISDPEEVINALSAFENVGAMTPNIAIGLANELFDLEIAPVTEEWGDMPFSLVRSAAGNSGISASAATQTDIDGAVASTEGVEKTGELAAIVRRSLIDLRNVLASSRIKAAQADTSKIRRRAPPVKE